MNALHITEELAFTTVRLEGRTIDGSTSTGTGFLYCVAAGADLNTVAIITNKHVVAAVEFLEFHVCISDGAGTPVAGRYHTLRLSELQGSLVHHPNPDVDLCALPCAGIIAVARARGENLFFRCFDRSHIPTANDEAELTALEPILMIGYPNGLWDHVNNRPLIRKGVTATQPSIDLNGKGEFLIDAACFPGSSGSPVMLWREPGYIDRRGNINMTGIKPKLLGALFAGPIATMTGEIVVAPHPTTAAQTAITGIPMNLGYVVKSRYLIDLEPEIVRVATRNT